MKTNKIDQEIKDKLASRTFAPSASAWDRLSAQLDEQPKQKKKAWFFYASYAASILLLIYAGFYVFSKDKIQGKPIEKIIVNQPISIDTVSIKNKIDKVFKEINEAPVIVAKDILENKEEQIVKQSKTRKYNRAKSEIAKTENTENNKLSVKTNLTINKEESNKRNLKKENTLVVKADKELQEITTNKKEKKKENKITIKVNGADLLFAVTHTNQEVKAYYAKYDVTREQVLKTIKSELKKTNLKVDPETILAEVENTINDDVFNNNFLNALKRRVSDIAFAIATRNN
ncbi:hypothetical protein [uncultured Polaribacter sp.]|uniref:hypothetical protein n=1 Tax=uncultured Polaribacter sp. TaxID=174711 RepID=UPI00260A4BA8|nr:hypothetical protein [uncultured Polaribacter sp.]